MKPAIDILMVESEPGFAAKIRRSLRRAGLSFHIKRIKTNESLLHELEYHCPDVIIADYVVSRLHRFAALAVSRERRPDVPFVFVTVSHETELSSGEAGEAGGDDQMLKSSLSNFAPTLRGALREARERTKLRYLELAVLTSRWSPQ